MKKKHLVVILIVMLVFSFLACSFAYAADPTGTTGGDLVAKATSAKDKVVKLIVDLAKIAAVVFIAWAGVIFWGAGGDTQKMAAAKSKMLYFFMALFLIFGAQGIVNTLLELFSQ